MVTFDDVVAAQKTIAGRLHRTPLVGSAALSERVGAPLYLKLENWQKTGSFKVRGVLNKLRTLTPAERARGLVTASAGNHAQALAWAAQAEGVPCTVVMPESAMPAKLAAVRGYGASVVLESTVMRVIERAKALADEQGLTYIPPFDDPAIIAGAGTTGLEIVEDLPDVGTIVVGIGGGGLIAGVAVAVKTFHPRVRIIGVEPEGAPSMRRSLDVGHPVRLESVATIADGLAPPYAGAPNFEIVRQYVDDVVLVHDTAIRDAMVLILERTKLLAEPSGAAGMAALLTGAATFDANLPVVAIISGGNVGADRLAQLIAGV
ncbi:MAG: threonine/serine dehydratase [Anaerolineae bacterium]